MGGGGTEEVTSPNMDDSAQHNVTICVQVFKASYLKCTQEKNEVSLSIISCNWKTWKEIGHE